MNQDRPSKSDLVDRLVRERLDQRTAQTDATALVSRIRESLADLPEKRVAPAARSASGRKALWLLSMSAAVLLAFVLGRSLTPSVADAETILRDVRSNHTQTIDRCYQVQFAPAPGYWNGKNALKGPSETILWTRGDRFWADAKLGAIQLVYGRDESGSLWISPSRSKGIRLSEQGEELPAEIEMYCAINSMTVPALVDDVLVDFDLRADPPVEQEVSDSQLDSSPGHTVVWAHLKPGRTHERISAALLEIDQTSTLVRVILWTLDEGQTRGTVTFTLSDSGPQNDDQYRLESHLDPQAEIETHRIPTETEGP